MSILLKNLQLFDSNKVVDIAVERGEISKIGKNLDLPKAKTHDFKGLLVSPGWVDLFADFGDPGYEEREGLPSGARLAAASGFTDICLIPNLNPTSDTKSSIRYIMNGARESIASIHPIGAVSDNCEGESMAELFDLYHAGAVYFSDGLKPIKSTELLLKALQYTQRFGGLVATNPVDLDLAKHGQMHEGVTSTSWGLGGIPRVSEIIGIKRDLEVLRYGGGRLHFSGISCLESVQLIAEAKKEGLQVTCDVPVLNLIFTATGMPPFSTAYKVTPPLREESDRQRLLTGLKDDVIDAISCRHLPRTAEEKDLEFDLAEFGASTLQTSFSVLQKLSKEVSFSKLVEKVTDGPRKILGLAPVKIAEGSEAKLSFFDPQKQWELNAQTNLSKSKNNPMMGQQLEGCAMGIVNGERYHFLG